MNNEFTKDVENAWRFQIKFLQRLDSYSLNCQEKKKLFHSSVCKDVKNDTHNSPQKSLDYFKF